MAMEVTVVGINPGQVKSSGANADHSPPPPLDWDSRKGDGELSVTNSDN